MSGIAFLLPVLPELRKSSSILTTFPSLDTTPALFSLELEQPAEPDAAIDILSSLFDVEADAINFRCVQLGDETITRLRLNDKKSREDDDAHMDTVTVR